jgi:hypothetical protein
MVDPHLHFGGTMVTRSRRLRRSAGERIARPRDIFRIDSAMLRESDQQGFLARHVIEHTKQEIRLARGIPDRLRPDPGEGQEAAESLRLARYEGERGDRDLFGGLSPSLAVGSAPLRPAPVFHGHSPRSRLPSPTRGAPARIQATL